MVVVNHHSTGEGARGRHTPRGIAHPLVIAALPGLACATGSLATVVVAAAMLAARVPGVA